VKKILTFDLDNTKLNNVCHLAHVVQLGII